MEYETKGLVMTWSGRGWLGLGRELCGFEAAHVTGLAPDTDIMGAWPSVLPGVVQPPDEERVDHQHHGMLPRRALVRTSCYGER